MICDRLFVYGTLMRGFDHPMARLLSANADFLGEATCRGRLYLVKHYPGLVLSDDPADIPARIEELRSEMLLAAEELEFEKAAGLRDQVEQLRAQLSPGKGQPQRDRGPQRPRR